MSRFVVTVIPIALAALLAGCESSTSWTITWEIPGEIRADYDEGEPGILLTHITQEYGENTQATAVLCDGLDEDLTLVVDLEPHFGCANENESLYETWVAPFDTERDKEAVCALETSDDGFVLWDEAVSIDGLISFDEAGARASEVLFEDYQSKWVTEGCGGHDEITLSLE